MVGCNMGVSELELDGLGVVVQAAEVDTRLGSRDSCTPQVHLDGLKGDRNSCRHHGHRVRVFGAYCLENCHDSPVGGLSLGSS